MFSLFGKKSRLPASEEEMRLLEEMFLELSYAFGNDFQKSRGFIYPVKELLPYDNLSDSEQLLALTRQIAGWFFIDPECISINKFSTLDPGDYTQYTSAQTSVPAVSYKPLEKDGKTYCDIVIYEEMLRNPMKTVYLLAFCCGGFIADQKGLKYTGKKSLYIRDVTLIFFGFGIFIDHVRLVKNSWEQTSIGKLPVGMIAGANSLYCHLFHCNVKRVATFFQSNSSELFTRCMNYYEEHPLLLINQERWKAANRNQLLLKELTDSFNYRDFVALEEEARMNYRMYPEQKLHLNNIGYWMLCQGKFSEAIPFFDELLKHKNDYAFGWNNRGYCKLMLGKEEEGKRDIEKSLELKPDNSFAWRNLGVYFLRNGNAEEALRHFEKAQQLDPETELIHFYLGSVYLLQGEKEKAHDEFNRSRAVFESPVPVYPEL